MDQAGQNQSCKTAGFQSFFHPDESQISGQQISTHALKRLQDRNYADTWRRKSIYNMLSDGEDAAVAAWIEALDLRDGETRGHSFRVAEMSVELARRIGVAELELKALWRGALLHDIGKLAVPDRILLKPGPLEASERSVMERHPEIAFSLLSEIPWLRDSLDIPLCHHERWDGSGYPFGLAGTDIPFNARLFAIVDVWDALRSDRPYRRSWDLQSAGSYLYSSAGILFDPDIVGPFLVWVMAEEHPSRLST